MEISRTEASLGQASCLVNHGAAPVQGRSDTLRHITGEAAETMTAHVPEQGGSPPSLDR